MIVAARETTTNIEESKVEAVSGSQVIQAFGKDESIPESTGVVAARANVEADANDIEFKVRSGLQELGPGARGSTKLGAELAEGMRVVRENSENKLGIREVSLDLLEFIGVVEGHHADAFFCSMSDVTGELTRIGKDDFVFVGKVFLYE